LSSCRNPACSGAHGEGGTRTDPDHVVIHSHARRRSRSSFWLREARDSHRRALLCFVGVLREVTGLEHHTASLPVHSFGNARAFQSWIGTHIAQGIREARAA